MKNFVQGGEVLTLTAPANITSGDGVLVGTNIFVVASSTVLSGAAFEGVTCGVFDINALSTDTGSVGAIMYWDNTNKRLTTTSAGNTKVGVLVAAKANGETTARVRLNGVFG